MGLFSSLFRDDSKDSSGSRVRVRQSNEDNSKRVADRYTDTGGGKHVHESYTLNTDTGSYREYSGGENSGDRGYNKS